LFSTKEISTAGDLLRYFPYKYLDRRSLSKISELTPGKDRVTAGKILACGLAFAGARRRKIFEILLGDESGTISLKWFRFNPRQMMGSFHKGMGLVVSGEAASFRNQIQFIHPTLEIVDPDVVEEIAAPGIVPVYSQIQGMGQKLIRKVVGNCLHLFSDRIQDPLPPEIRERLHLPDKRTTLEEIHFPRESTSLEHLLNHRTPVFKREIFEEFFFMELGLALKRKTITREQGISIEVPEDRLAAWESQLPFRLTGAQGRVFREIARDLGGPHPMNRLVQGDVGSGKTVVALLAAMAAIEKGYQAALMAPTEILAEQHYRSAQKLFAPFKVPVALLTGSLEASEKKRAHGRIAKGYFPLVVGTHALVAEKLAFKSLGLVVIDEQHRFGVLQRAALKEKGQSPHVLVMTATPIPRTLAMTIYGDLDLSVIDEMPPGRQPIRTQLVGEKSRRQLYAAIGEILRRGDQGYVVYPLIEESEKLPLRDATRMYEEIRRVFPDRQVALLHGKTPQEEKEAVMRSFKAGDIHLLISTTVIEVGIDVPNATLMVVEHAERFGLSQLHQLRGRVGRGDKPSHCLLVTGLSSSNPGFRRLEVMCETNDGFKIAEEDLKIRGPGDFLGTRQSGLPELRVANLIRDYKILEVARAEAFAWLERDPALSLHPPVKETLRRRWGQKLALADIG
jgi:ATP-dependent DNA helicase RecG